MLDWSDEVTAAVSDFETVSKIAGGSIRLADCVLEFLPAPHVPPQRLPEGKMAVYGFWWNGEWLKIGKVGPRSSARYTSQHYNLDSGRSTLAASLANDDEIKSADRFDPSSPGNWIKANTNRVNILIPADRRYDLLSLLESFLHVRLSPRYEG